jgi:hypothetical protein
MPQHAEAFPQEDFQPKPYPEKELEKKSAVILPFLRKENIRKGNYAEYRALHGTLSPEEYQDVLRRAMEASRWLENANSMARAAEITLSPETMTLYGILRDEKPDPAKKHYSELSDQELLAEALRIVGNKPSLDTFIKRFTPTVFH